MIIYRCKVLEVIRKGDRKRERKKYVTEREREKKRNKLK
jgi:hypothetical protein